MPSRLKKCILLSLVFLLFAFDVFGRHTNIDDQVKAIAERYNDIEMQLGRSLHYLSAIDEKAGDIRETRQAWLNEAGDPLKVSIEEKGKEDRNLTEIFFSDQVIFVLERDEKALPDGSTHVSESRKYFGNIDTGTFSSDEALLRELKKDALFKPGDSLDTMHVKNIDASVDHNVSSENYQQKADEILESFMRATPVSGPSAKPSGDSEKYRLMQQTASPNGRYALGWAPNKTQINWKDYADSDIGGFSVDTDKEKPKNYVVDLNTHRILGSTGCQFDGTRKRYNHRENIVAWSPNSDIFIQTTCWKWYSDRCCVGMLKESKLAGVIDLLDIATRRAYGFLASRKDNAFKKHGRDF